MGERARSYDDWLHDAGLTLWRYLHCVEHGITVAWHSVISSPWTIPVVILAIVAPPLTWTIYAHRTWKKGWLSELIAHRYSEISKKRPAQPVTTSKRWWPAATDFRLNLVENWDRVLTYFQSKFVADLRRPYFPSFISFGILFIGIAAFFVIPRHPSIASVMDWRDWGDALTTDLNDERSKTQELIVGTFTGLAVVIIALIVFVAESIRDNKDTERKRILAEKSYLWPLGVAATLIPFGFLWSSARGLTILLEIIVATITLASFARVIRALFDPETEATDRIKDLRKRVGGMISDSARVRIGNSILFEQLGPSKRIDTFQYRSRGWLEDEDCQFISASTEGWIGDIHLDELKQLGDRLDRYARENLGFALRQSGPDIQPAKTGGGPTGAASQALEVQKAYLLKRYREEIPPDSIFYGKHRAIFALPEGLTQRPEILADINASIAHIFRFTQDEPSSVAIRREMQGTKDRLAQAIRDKALGEIDDLRQTYLSIAEEFLTKLVDFGGGYTAEQARQERGNVFESWSEIRWLQDDLRELTIIASDAGNTDVLSKIAFLPFAIATRAIQARDHFLFQQFFQFASFLYFLGAEKEEGSSVRPWLIDKSWRWPKEIIEFYIGHDLGSKNSSIGDLQQMRDFALYSLRVFQDLLKAMADKRDVVAFNTVSREFKRLYRRFRGSDDQPNVDILRLQIDRAENEEARATLTALLDRQLKRQSVVTELNLSIDEIVLALGGRILAQYLEAPDDGPIGTLFDAIIALLPNDLRKLAAAFAAASEWQAPEAWGWNFWDSIADGEAHWVDSHTKLNQIFIVQALRLLEELPAELRAAVQFPVSNSLAEMAREENGQGLLPTLNAIEANPDRWNRVLNQNARNRIGVLRERLTAVRAAEIAAAAEATKQAPLDPTKVATFRDELVRSFSESGRLREVLHAKGALNIDLSKSPGPPVQSLGLTQIDDKNAFIKQEHTAYAGWGRNYGQSMAHGEDEETFATMIGAAMVKETVIAGALIGTIERVIRNVPLKDPIILQSLEFDVRYAHIERNPAFRPKYAPDSHTTWHDFNGFMGLLTVGSRQVPVFDTFVRRPESQNHVLVLDAQQFVRWDQFAPSPDPDQQTFGNGQLLIEITDLNADAVKRNEIIAQNPPWLAEEPNPAEYLRGRVLINVYEKFHLEILLASQGACLTVPSA
jgi:hypothetical protein